MTRNPARFGVDDRQAHLLDDGVEGVDFLLLDGGEEGCRGFVEGVHVTVLAEKKTFHRVCRENKDFRSGSVSHGAFVRGYFGNLGAHILQPELPCSIVRGVRWRSPLPRPFLAFAATFIVAINTIVADSGVAIAFVVDTSVRQTQHTECRVVERRVETGAVAIVVVIPFAFMVGVIAWLFKISSQVLLYELEDVWLLPFELIRAAVIPNSTRAQCEEGWSEALKIFEFVFQTR